MQDLAKFEFTDMGQFPGDKAGPRRADFMAVETDSQSAA
jgi:hypothetical protein